MRSASLLLGARPPFANEGRVLQALLLFLFLSLLTSFATPARAELGNCSNNYDEFLKLKNFKAMALGSNKYQCYWSHQSGSQEQANKEVLKHCRKTSKTCDLIDVYGEIRKTTTEAQEALKELGIYTGTVDGKAGPSTRASVSEFEKLRGIKPDGKIGNELLSRLRAVIKTVKGPIKALCQQATAVTDGLSRWDARAQYAIYVKAAKQKGLTEAACDRELGRKRTIAKANNSETPRSDNSICHLATVNANGLSRWDSSARYAKFVTEAKSRNLSESDCDRLLNRKATGAIAPDPLASMTERALCGIATMEVDGLSRWENRAQFANRVEAAKRRGLTEAQCDRLLQRKSAGTRNDLATIPERSLCQWATRLGPDGLSRWETAGNWPKYATEARRRGFSEADCDLKLGRTAKLAEAAKSPPAAEPAPQIASAAAIDDKSLCKLATRQIAARPLEWDASLAAYVDDAKKRGLKIETCAELLGVQPQVAALPEPAAAPKAQNAVPSFAAGKRLALVIGNGAYRHAPELLNPRNDAEAMSKLLKQMGFEVIAGLDLDKDGMERSIREFARKAPSVDLALFFYAGHGLQIGSHNYLVPIDAKVEEATAVDFELFNLDQTVMKYLGGESKVGIVMLDACRNNPLSRSLARAFGATRSGEIGMGLAPVHGQGGLLVSFATAPGEVAADGEGVNSPYTTALLKHLPTAELEVELALKRVSREVYLSTGRQQQPWHNSALREEVYLVGK